MSERDFLLAISNMMDEKLAPIKDDINILKADVSELKADVTDLKADVTNLKTDMVEVKEGLADLRTEMFVVKTDISELKMGAAEVKVIIEGEIRPHIRLLAENYVPASRKFEEKAADIDIMRSEIRLLNEVVAEHSRMLKKIS